MTITAAIYTRAAGGVALVALCSRRRLETMR